jgi:four helix bundle protein
MQNAKREVQLGERLVAPMNTDDDRKPRDIQERTFIFAVRIVRLCRYLDQQSGVERTLSKQLLRAATSVGANIEEAQAGQSRPDFINKCSIALKEARETHYWLRILLASELLPEVRVSGLLAEAEEIKRIIGAIIVSAKKMQN